ncbi:ABC transporter substrate-binding protein [Ketogulonicigenium vulgare]|uniref:ABC transporter substrate-binding protein n=1 Tax=Ketogulonicigenium vulgare TaxID=92945 RepID=UPI002359E311|nr:ABC transporter substrate-binding protein [Ketogulonicigenium vulgare]
MVSYVKAVAGASAIASLLPALAAYAQPAPTTGGTYYHALEAAVTCIDPPTQIFHVALNVGRQLVDSLVDQDPQTGAIVPWIAERWDISEDAQTFTFHLRQGSHFADGAPIDAAAVQANIDRIAALGPRAVGAAPLLIGYTGTEVIDPQTVRITFDRPAVQFLQALSGAWFGLISPNDLGKSADALCAGDFAGSGPFITASYQGDTEIVLQRRDGYDSHSSLAGHTGDAYVDALHLVVIPEAGNRAGAVQTGEVHSASNIAFQHVPVLEQLGLTLLSPHIPGMTESLIFNRETAIGQDDAVRQAIQHAINSEELIRTVWGPSWTPRTAVLSESTPGWADFSDLLTFDEGRANAILDEAGWLRGEDGFRSRDGQRLSVRIIMSSPASDQLVKQQLAAVGIDYNIERLDSATSTARVQAGEYDIYKWQMTRADPAILNAVWNSNRTSQGVARSPASELDDLLLVQESAIDTAARAAAAADVQRYLIENALVVPLVDRAWTYAIHPSGQGLRLDGETKLVFFDVFTDR